MWKVNVLLLYLLGLINQCLCQLPDFDRDQMAWLVPNKGNISSECRYSSNQLIDQLLNWNGNLESGMPDLLSMIDSDGRMPIEGFLSDLQEVELDLCPLLEQIGYSCDLLPAGIPHVITILIPVGYSNNPGNQGECYSEELASETQYCSLKLNGPEIDFGGRSIAKQNKIVKDLTLENMASVGHSMRQYQELEKTRKRSNSTGIKLNIFDASAVQAFLRPLKSSSKTNAFIDDITSVILMEGLAIYSSIAHPEIGMCFPMQCTKEDINENYRYLTSKGDLKIRALSCFPVENKSGTPETAPAWFVFFWTIYVIILISLIISTSFDVIYTLILQKKSNSLSIKLLRSFSIYSNGKVLLSTVSTSKDHLDCMNGMRFISMTWVVLGHSFFISFFGANRNSAVIYKIFDGQIPFALEVIVNAYPSVDTFFVMSGALTTYIFLKELTKAGNNILKHTVAFLLYYIHRYIRITIPYFLVMGVIISVLPYVYYGPGWEAILRESQGCRNFWWAHILYIHTLIDKDKYDYSDEGSCMAVSWYLVDDMMFHIISPVVIYPLYLLSRNQKHIWSTLYWFLTLALSTFGVFYIALTTHLPPIKNMDFPDLNTDYTYRIDLYYAPWGRYQAYLIGIFLGYILHHLRGKSVNIPWYANIAGWILSFLSAFTVVYGIHNARVTHEISLLNATLYNTFQRVMWNVSMSWVIFSCSKGYGGLIAEFLSWSTFAPLSKLTFCAYLIHINIVIMFGSSVLSSFPNDFEYFSTTWTFLAILLISLVLAFGLTLIFEIPFTKAEKLLVEAVISSLVNKSSEQQNEIPKPKIEDEAATKDVLNEDLDPSNLEDKAVEANIVERKSSGSSSSEKSDPPPYDVIMENANIKLSV